MGSICSQNRADPPGSIKHKRRKFIIPTTAESQTSRFKRYYKLMPNVLGTGSFGKVVLADTKLGLRAVKVIKQEILAKANLHWQEIEVLRALSHPNIMKLYDVIEIKDVYFIMEYC